jgi:hypothetical protein
MLQMKKPIQALLIAPDETMRANIISGKKRITIREGFRDYNQGAVMLCCHIEPWAVLADITEVKHCLISQLDHADIVADGFSTRMDLIDGLRKYYPNISVDSAVTVIRWENARGKLVGSWLSNDYRDSQ